jgi:hypothetical protein
MGLLDDAIREHLELKRRRGADPSEVARQQREALAPVGGPRDASWDEEELPEDGLDDDEAVAEPSAAGAGDDHPTEAHETVTPSIDDAAHMVEETAEIDMQTVLDADVAAPPASEASGVQESDGLEWEPPARAAEDPGEVRVEDHGEAPAGDRGDVPPEIPGQERMPFE